MNTTLRSRTILAALLAIEIFSASAIANACPHARKGTLPAVGIAATDTSSIDYRLSSKGSFRVTRTLLESIPVGTASCTVTLEGRYTRKQSLSRKLVLGTTSSVSDRVVFRARKLPPVKADVFRKQTIQPVLHVRVITQCVDGANSVTLSDTTPVVSRYADCGSGSSPVAMSTFVNQLITKLSR